MIVSVRDAFSTHGSSKAVTPFETASTPVIAAHPLANVFIDSHMERLMPARIRRIIRHISNAYRSRP